MRPNKNAKRCPASWPRPARPLSSAAGWLPGTQAPGQEQKYARGAGEVPVGRAVAVGETLCVPIAVRWPVSTFSPSQQANRQSERSQRDPGAIASDLSETHKLRGYQRPSPGVGGGLRTARVERQWTTAPTGAQTGHHRSRLSPLACFFSAPRTPHSGLRNRGMRWSLLTRPPPGSPDIS
jgi:hypothetical protein